MDKQTKKFITGQRKEIETWVNNHIKESNEQFQRLHKEMTQSSKDFEKSMRKMGITLTKRIDDKAEESERYLGAIIEDSNSKFKLIMEILMDFSEVKDRLSIMFDNMGEQEVNIAVTKDSLRDHEHRIKILEIKA